MRRNPVRGPGSNQHQDKPLVLARYPDPDGEQLRSAANAALGPPLDEMSPHAINLRDKNLRKASLAGADLRDADLQDAVARDANLRGADLRGANLNSCTLLRADLRGANLAGATLRRADLRAARITGACLDGTDFQGARVDTSTDISLPGGWRTGDSGRLERAPAVGNDDLYDDDAFGPTVQ